MRPRTGSAEGARSARRERQARAVRVARVAGPAPGTRTATGNTARAESWGVWEAAASGRPLPAGTRRARGVEGKSSAGEGAAVRVRRGARRRARGRCAPP